MKVIFRLNEEIMGENRLSLYGSYSKLEPQLSQIFFVCVCCRDKTVLLQGPSQNHS